MPVTTVDVRLGEESLSTPYYRAADLPLGLSRERLNHVITSSGRRWRRANPPRRISRTRTSSWGRPLSMSRRSRIRSSRSRARTNSIAASTGLFYRSTPTRRRREGEDSSSAEPETSAPRWRSIHRVADAVSHGDRAGGVERQVANRAAARGASVEAGFHPVARWLSASRLRQSWMAGDSVAR